MKLLLPCGLNGLQVPLLIAFSSQIIKGNTEVLTTKTFLIEKTLLYENLEKALKDLLSNFYSFFSLRGKKGKLEFEIIFVHNLGGFDGYFIYKALSSISEAKVNTIIDNHNNFIIINFKNSYGKILVFKDYLRIFPASLYEICKVFLPSPKGKGG